MTCDKCQQKALVIDCRPYTSKRTGEQYIIRRRECPSGHRFTTYETRKNPEELK